MNDKNIITLETIERYRKEQGISRRALAIAVGIPPSTLQAAFDKARKLSLENIIKIAAYLKIPKYLTGRPYQKSTNGTQINTQKGEEDEG